MNSELGTLLSFLKESNRIEGIEEPLISKQLSAAQLFLRLDAVDVGDMESIVSVFQPGAVLRDKVGLDVRVGSHTPPRGNPQRRTDLEIILKDVNDSRVGPYETHHRYETLHPFTDGNGRSGRLLWAWQMIRWPGPGLEFGFLHAWYYQSLQAGEGRR